MKATKAVVELQPDGRKTVFNACTEPCPIERGMRIIGGKWKGSILWHLQDGPVRFNDLARQLGATRAINVTKPSPREVMKELGMTEGFDVGLEMSGSHPGFASLIDNMAHGGKIAILGIPPGKMAIDWTRVIFKGLVIKGIYGREMYETWYLMQSMLRSGLDISPVITHRFHYTEFEQAFEVMRSGNSGKVIMNWVDE